MANFDSKDDTHPPRRQAPTSASADISGSPPSTPRRRHFLQMALGGAIGGLAAPLGMEFLSPSSAEAQTILTPKMALNELVRGNRRFVALRMRSFAQDLAILRNHTSELQQPFAAVLSCADSRVPVELVFDQSIGQLFVTRVAGNVTTSEIIASLEYGVAVLGVKVILVMGHGSCGAIEAAIQGKEAPGQISSLYPHLQPALDEAAPDVEATIKVNAKLQADLLRKASTVISAFLKEDKLLVLSAFYNIASGEVTLLDQDADQDVDTNG